MYGSKCVHLRDGTSDLQCIVVNRCYFKLRKLLLKLSYTQSKIVSFTLLIMKISKLQSLKRTVSKFKLLKSPEKGKSKNTLQES